MNDGQPPSATRSNTESSPPVSRSPVTEQPAVVEDLLVTGSRLDRYIVLECQGRGGMGVVYSAYDPKLERKIALKLLRGGDVGGRRRQRLLREAQALAQLAHPNVIVVFDVASVGDQVFLAMEFVAGQTLRAWLQQSRSWRDVLRVFVGAGRGLAAAHAANVIHRDFKPDNVLVGSDGRARVADFGLARSAAEAVADATASTSDQADHVTVSGTIVGTPGYMSPEQTTGERVDARSDQYSFCVALFEALHGHRPGAGGPPAPAEARIPSHLRRALERGLRAAPAERFRNMDALLAQLMRAPRASRLVLATICFVGLTALALFAVLRDPGQPNLLCRGSERKLAGVWNGAHRDAARAAFFATQKPFAEAAWTSVERALDRGGAAWAAEWTETCEATRVRGEQSEEVLDLRMDCLEAQRREVAAFVRVLASPNAELLKKAPQEAQSLTDFDQCRHTDVLRQVVRPPRDLNVRVQVQALQTLLADARALRQAGKYAVAAQQAGNVLTAARSLGYLPLVADARFVLALAQEQTGDRQAAAEGLLEAASLAETARDDHLRARALAELVRVLGRLARYEEADGYAALAEATTTRAGGDDDLRVGLLKARYIVRKGRGRYDEAVALSKQVVALREGTAATQPALLAGALLNLGEAYRTQGDRDQSIAVSKRALAMFESALGSAHPYTGLAINNIGAAYGEKHQYAESLQYLQRSLAIREAALGPDHLEVATDLQNVGMLLADLDQFDRARPLLERALAIREKALGPAHPQVAMNWWSLAQLELQRRNPSAALPLARRALTIREQKLGPAHPDVAFSWDQVAQAELALGHVTVALGLSERAVAVIEHEPQMGLELAEARFTLARALWETRRDHARARKLAIAARDELATQGEPLRKELLEAETWLHDHGGAAP